MIGELKFFLGLQIKQTPNGIYIHHTKYMKELLKKFNMNDAKELKTRMHPTIYLEKDGMNPKTLNQRSINERGVTLSANCLS